MAIRVYTATCLLSGGWVGADGSLLVSAVIDPGIDDSIDDSIDDRNLEITFKKTPLLCTYTNYTA